MDPNVLELQKWLNSKGASLAPDGVKGPLTRAAVFTVFRNTGAPAVSQVQIEGFANRLRATPRQLMAVAQTESRGNGWDNDGMLTVLYERHYLFRRLKMKIPFLSDPAPGGYTVDVDHDGLNDSWEKLADSAMIAGPATAFECASFGMFQIMGAWWQKLGYTSAIDFAYAMSRRQAEHYEAFVRYVERFDLVQALRKVDGNPANCTAFARGYNGPKQQDYDVKIAANFRRLA